MKVTKKNTIFCKVIFSLLMIMICIRCGGGSGSTESGSTESGSTESGSSETPTLLLIDVSLSSVIKAFKPTHGNPVWLDYDNDGRMDVFVVNHRDKPSLLYNNGGGTFTDSILTSEIALNGDKHGVGIADYDNDGNIDIFITTGGRRGDTVGNKKDQLYRNDGSGHFTDVTDSAGVANAFGRGRSVNWVDYNNDGHLDLFIKNHETLNVLYRNNGVGTFTDVAQPAGIANAKGEVSTWIDYDKDGDMDLFITSAAKDQLWQNNGNGAFAEVTKDAGLKELSNGQGVAWGDYNNDGYVDLYVARGFSDVNDSLSWDGANIIFSDQEAIMEDGLDFVASATAVTFDLYLEECHQITEVFIGEQKISPSTMPFTLTELEANGKPSYISGQDIGFYVWKDGQGWHIRWNSDGLTTTYFYGKIISDGLFSSVNALNFQRKTPVVKGTLYKNNGDGTFTDATDIAGVGVQTNNRAAIWGDYDNDGYLDLYVVNSGSFKGNDSNILYRNNGDGTFTEVTKQTGVQANVKGRGDGAAWGDFNNDGFLDLYITNGWGPPILPLANNGNCLSSGPHLLFQSNSSSNNKWLKVNLIGTVSNKDGLGAKITLIAGGLTQLREANGGGGGQFFSQGNGQVHFGLGHAGIVESLTIKWLSGITQTLTNISPNQSITVFEPSRP